MKKTAKQIMTASVVAAITISNMNSIIVCAAPSRRVTSVLPQAGFTYALGDNQVSLSTLQNSMNEEDSNSSKGASKKGDQANSSSSISKSVADKIDSSSAVTDTTPSASSITNSILRDIQAATGAVNGESSDDQSEDSSSVEEMNYDNLVVAKVEDYVYIRDYPDKDQGEVVGKLFDKSVGSFIEEKDGWYKIKSGDVEGWVKGEFCIKGSEAADYAMKEARVEATVSTTDSVLNARSEASVESKKIGYVSQGEIYEVIDSVDGWAKISMEEGDAWLSTDFLTINTVFQKAISKKAEEAQLAKEKAELEANKKAASKSTSDKAEGKNYKSAASYTTETSSIGSAVAEFAKQFVGNPYVYGGTSLTEGADCSGFVMSVYKNFGVSLPHSSGADRSVGAAVDGLGNAQPGDIVCYSGHVGIYIGGGQIVHASTAATGIKVSNADYRTVLAVRRIF